MYIFGYLQLGRGLIGPRPCTMGTVQQAGPLRAMAIGLILANSVRYVLGSKDPLAANGSLTACATWKDRCTGQQDISLRSMRPAAHQVRSPYSPGHQAKGARRPGPSGLPRKTRTRIKDLFNLCKQAHRIAQGASSLALQLINRVINSET